MLQRYLDSLIDTALNNETGRRGCFIANTAMELGAVDLEISRRFEVFTSDMEIAFYRFLMRAQELGKLKAGRDIRETARFLVATRHGLYVLAKTATNRKILEDTAKVAVSAVFD
ncbi:TetR family transcriptional regulator C-terminal domain-containing protein [Paenibacillus barengoltzii]|uniref:TetR family transcriptional regulator C-terminal domain-containing protein n=1 Tax=Paenibacillus barengoltzii TaxID=343517 RepID=UPI00068896F8|nr:TetR family transcriptional regulator C-terminal domain-containing protein [Paenibacillus barengoltzii]